VTGGHRQLRDQHRRRREFGSHGTHQRLHRRVQPPLRHLGGDQVIEALDAFAWLGDGQEIFLQHGLQRRNGSTSSRR